MHVTTLFERGRNLGVLFCYSLALAALATACAEGTDEEPSSPASPTESVEQAHVEDESGEEIPLAELRPNIGEQCLEIDREFPGDLNDPGDANLVLGIDLEGEGEAVGESESFKQPAACADESGPWTDWKELDFGEFDIAEFQIKDIISGKGTKDPSAFCHGDNRVCPANVVPKQDLVEAAMAFNTPNGDVNDSFVDIGLLRSGTEGSSSWFGIFTRSPQHIHGEEQRKTFDIEEDDILVVGDFDPGKGDIVAVHLAKKPAAPAHNEGLSAAEVASPEGLNNNGDRIWGPREANPDIIAALNTTPMEKGTPGALFDGTDALGTEIPQNRLTKEGNFEVGAFFEVAIPLLTFTGGDQCGDLLYVDFITRPSRSRQSALKDELGPFKLNLGQIDAGLETGATCGGSQDIGGLEFRALPGTNGSSAQRDDVTCEWSVACGTGCDSDSDCDSGEACDDSQDTGICVSTCTDSSGCATGETCHIEGDATEGICVIGGLTDDCSATSEDFLTETILDSSDDSPVTCTVSVTAEGKSGSDFQGCAGSDTAQQDILPPLSATATLTPACADPSGDNTGQFAYAASGIGGGDSTTTKSLEWTFSGPSDTSPSSATDSSGTVEVAEAGPSKVYTGSLDVSDSTLNTLTGETCDITVSDKAIPLRPVTLAMGEATPDECSVDSGNFSSSLEGDDAVTYTASYAGGTGSYDVDWDPDDSATGITSCDDEEQTDVQTDSCTVDPDNATHLCGAVTLTATVNSVDLDDDNAELRPDAADCGSPSLSATYEKQCLVASAISCADDSDCASGSCTDGACDAQETGCTADGDCEGDQLCDTATGACVDCFDESDCPDGVCLPDSNACVECFDEDHCEGDLICNLQTFTCAECEDSASHCSSGEECIEGECVVL
jgi:hypothetical protein